MLALRHTSSLRRFNSHRTTFRKSNKNSLVLKQMLKMLPSWLNVLSTTAGHIIYSLEFLPRNCWNPMTGTYCTPNINFFVIKREFLNRSGIFCTPIQYYVNSPLQVMKTSHLKEGGSTSLSCTDWRNWQKKNVFLQLDHVSLKHELPSPYTATVVKVLWLFVQIFSKH